MSLIKVGARAAYAAQRAQDNENQGLLDKTERVARAARATEKFEPANADLRSGVALPRRLVEARLLEEIPNLQFLDHPTNASKRCMYLRLPDGGTQYLMPYENSPILPEHSIMTEQYEDVLDPDALKQSWNLSDYKADFPKHEATPCEVSSTGEITKMGNVIFDESKPLPGFKRYRIGWREVTRGYRTMCGILMTAGLLTEAQAERVAGPSSSAQWAGATGRRPKEEPWA